MAQKTIEIIRQLDYNEQIALAVIESDSDLSDIFLSDTGIKTFTLIRQLIKDKQLKSESLEFLYQLFYGVIQTKQELIDKYLQLQNNGDFTSPQVSEEIIEPIVISVVKEPEPIKEVKLKVDKKLPRRYGKDFIVKDIEKQGGVATNVQLTALAANDLKNTWTNLTARLIKDMFSDNVKLTDEEYRVIRSTITLLERKIKPILKKK